MTEKILKSVDAMMNWQGGRKTLTGMLKLTLCLTCIFCTVLWITGLSSDRIQQRINKNVLQSAEQFKAEGVYPQILSAKDYSYRLDNWTDMTILQESLFMNTSKAPKSIFTNPRVNKTYDNAEYSERILALEEAARTNQANTFYTYYWIGIRALIRPLLIFMPYQSIRGVIAAILIGLFLMAAVAIHDALGKGFCGAFAIAVASMNLPVIMSEIQYVPCFWIAFLSICFVIRAARQGKWSRLPALFFITGAGTQFLDFYTFPLITVGFPAVVMVGLMARGKGNSKRVWSLGKCVASWGMGYGLLWLIRLVLVTVLTEHNAWASAWDSFFKWTGVVVDDRYARFIPAKAIELCFETLMKPHVQCILIVAAAIYVVCLLRSLIMSKTIGKPSVCYLLIACLPFLWMTVAAKATGNHSWFQYRLLAVLIFSVFAFLSELIPDKRKCPADGDIGRLPKKSGDTPV